MVCHDVHMLNASTRSRLVRCGAAVLVSTLTATSCGIDIDDTADVVGSTVAVEVTACGRPERGTAVAVGNELFVTAAHVVAGSEVVGLDLAGTTVDAIPVVVNTDIDIAVLRVAGYTGPALALGGDRIDTVVAAILALRDDPLKTASLRRIVWTNSTDIYRQGSVVRLALELDLDIAPGDSGAPIIGADGTVAGIVVSEVTGEPITYAVHPSEIRPLVDRAQSLTAAVRTDC